MLAEALLCTLVFLPESNQAQMLECDSANPTDGPHPLCYKVDPNALSLSLSLQNNTSVRSHVPRY